MCYLSHYSCSYIYLLRISACMSILCLGTSRFVSLLCLDILPIASAPLTTTRSFPRIGLRKGRRANRTETNISSSSVSASYGLTHLTVTSASRESLINVIFGSGRPAHECEWVEQIRQLTPSADQCRLSADSLSTTRLAQFNLIRDVYRNGGGRDETFLSISWNSSVNFCAKSLKKTPKYAKPYLLVTQNFTLSNPGSQKKTKFLYKAGSNSNSGSGWCHVKRSYQV